MPATSNPTPSETTPAVAPRLMAVIEMGTTSIRMAIAEPDPAGGVRMLESLQQTVTLGKDTFTRGAIDPATTEACVRVLRGFRHTLDQYRITNARDIVAIATSAVREASNRDAFLDRLAIATGFAVDAVENAEIIRYNYQAVRPLIDADPALSGTDVLALEVGGGSTELLAFRRGLVDTTHGYRLGSMRLRRMLEEQRAPTRRLFEIMRGQVDLAVDLICKGVPASAAYQILALGGDARFAASRFKPEWDLRSTVKLRVPALTRLAEEVLGQSVDDVAERYRLSYPEAETLGPALLVYARLAQAMKQRHLFVGRATLRDGVLLEMAARGSWTEEFRRQVVNSALEVGRKYGFDAAHAERVAAYASQIFRAMRGEHRLEPRHELILTIAALLHEIGQYVSNRSHHKHSMYLIQHSDLFGLGSRDVMLTALVARYHRRATPQPTHEYYDVLDRESRLAVSQMAAMLRLADALDRGRVPHARMLAFAFEPDKIIITVENAEDLTMEQYGLREKAAMFEQVFGMEVVLRGVRGGSRNGGA